MGTTILLGLLGCICASAMAGLSRRNFPVLLQGLNQKAPGQTGIPGTLGACLNMWALKGMQGGFEFIPRPAVTRVPVTADVGTISTGMRLATLGSSLLMMTGSACYRNAIDEWHSVSQNTPTVGVKTAPITTDSLVMNAVDTVYVNGYQVNAVAQGDGTTAAIRVTVFDANGAAVISNLLVDSGTSVIGVKIIKSGTVAVVFWESLSANKIRASKFDSAAPTTMTAPVDVATTTAAIAFSYDAQTVPSTGKIAVAWVNSGTTQLNQVLVTPSSMAVSGVTAYAGLTGLQTMGYMTNDFSTNNLYLAHVDPINGLRRTTFDGGTLALGTTTVFDAASTGAINIAGNRAGASESIYFTTTGANVYDNLLKRSNGGAAAVICRGIDLASRVLSANGTLYAMARYRGPGQGTYFLLDLNGFNAIGKALPDLASTVAIASQDQLPNLAATGVTGNTYLTAGLKNLAVAVTNGTVAAYVGAVSMAWTFSDASVGRGVELNGGVHFPGAMPYLYDGSIIVEDGFPIAPEKFDGVVLAGGGGLTASSTYTYRDVYEWTDAAGNIHRSAPSPPQQVVLGAGQTQVTRNIPTLRLTRKTNVAVASYRSPANGDGSVLYKINAATAPVVNITTADRVTVADTLADTALVAGEPIYVTGNVLENISPPPCKAIAVHRGRLLVGGVDGDSEAVWFSKNVSPGFGVSFNDALVSRLNSTSEPVTAVGSLDSQAIACTLTTEWTSSSDYPDDTGTGGVLQFSQQSGMTGCTGATLLGRTDQGIMTWGGPLKGVWRQSRGGGFDYVGSNIEDEAQLAADFTPNAMVTVPALNQIRMVGTWSNAPNGLNAVFVYETIFGTWSKWTYQAGKFVDAVMWNGVLTYLDDSGFVYTETTNLNTIDDVMGVTAPIIDGHSITFSAFNFADIAGYQRVFGGQLTGRVYGGGTCNIGITQVIDGLFPVPVKVATINGGVSNPVLNTEFDPGNAGKCSSIAITVSDAANSPNTSFTLVGVTFDVGVKPRMNRLPPSRRAV